MNRPKQMISSNIGTNIVHMSNKPSTRVWFNQRGGKIYKITYDQKTKQYTENISDFNQFSKKP
jgi:hypothetical protein